MARFLVLVATSMVLVMPGAARANDGWISGAGGTVKLLDEHPAITMAAEYVQARVSFSSSLITTECLFVLINSGQAATVMLGFPESWGGALDEGEPFHSFESFVDGEPIAATRQLGEDNTGGGTNWWTKQVSFAAGQTRVVRVVYASDAGGTLVRKPRSVDRFFDYVLETGASWSGAIGSAVIELSFDECPPDGLKCLSSNPVLVDGCRVIWHFKDIEPGQRGPARIKAMWSGPRPN